MARTSTGARRARRAPDHRRDEQGAVAVVVGICVLLLAGVASFAVDLGYQRVAARDMQAVADLVAMDMSRQLDGRTTNQILNSGNWVNTVQGSLDYHKQDHTVGDPLTAVSCAASAVTAADARLTSGIGICAYPGVLNADGTFSASGAAPATHVKVLDRTEIDYFLPVYAEGGSVARAAVAEAVKSACFAMGSYLVGLSTGESPILNAILGDALNTSVLSYSGLVGVRLTLLDLAVALDAGTPQELLATEVTAGELFTAMATAVSKNQPQTSADISAISVLQAAASASTPAFALGDLISLGSDSTSALTSTVDVLDLVKAAAFMSNDDPNVEGDESFLDIPGASVGVPGATNVTVKLGLVQGPRIYCGPPNTGRRVSSNQGTLRVSYELLGLPVVSAPVKVTVDLKLANANGELTSVTGCPDVTGLTVGITGQTVADLDVTLETKVAVSLLGLGLTVLDVVARPVPLASPTQSSSVTISPLPSAYGQKFATGSGTLGLQTLQSTQVKAYLAGVESNLLGTLLGPVTTVLAGVVSAVNTTVIPTLRSQLGLTLAGAHVWAIRPDRATCTLPRLAG